VSRGPDLLSLDTELDRRIHRPPARFLARFFSLTPLTPNQLSLLSLVPAAAAASGFARGTAASAIAAAPLFYLWAVLDHADGELARLTGRESAFGRRLDDCCDSAASAVLLAGIFLGALRGAPPGARPAWTAAFGAGLVLNAACGALILGAKRAARREAAANGREDAEFRRFHRALDRWTGRDPFYFLVLATIAAFGLGGVFPGALLAVLVGGCYALAAASAAAARRIRRGRCRDIMSAQTENLS
jgi:phosphatidylglycerophosphate synthase